MGVERSDRRKINAKQAHAIGHLLHQCHNLYHSVVWADRLLRMERMQSASSGELPADLIDQDAGRFNFEVQPQPETAPEPDIHGPNSDLENPTRSNLMQSRATNTGTSENCRSLFEKFVVVNEQTAQVLEHYARAQGMDFGDPQLYLETQAARWNRDAQSFTPGDRRVRRGQIMEELVRMNVEKDRVFSFPEDPRLRRAFDLLDAPGPHRIYLPITACCSATFAPPRSLSPLPWHSATSAALAPPNSSLGSRLESFGCELTLKRSQSSNCGTSQGKLSRPNSIRCFPASCIKSTWRVMR